MKTLTIRLAVVALCLAATQSARAILGYYNQAMSPGVNLIAYQLLPVPGNPFIPDNTLNTILNLTSGTPGTPAGTTFTKWDGADFLTLSVFDAGSGTWSINYSLNLGEGGYLYTPNSFTNTFVGEIGPYVNLGGGTRQTNWNPNYADGLHLISCPSPFGNATFEEVVGRAPRTGEWVRILNEETQTYSITTFNGSSWDNGTPVLVVGQAAWFDLGPVIVPEPSALAMTGLAAVLLGLRRRR